jgi:Uma2 family endonuclease
MPAERAYVPNMPLMSAEQLLQTNIPNKRTELVRGVLIVRELHGARHGMVVANLCGEIGTHVHAHQLGTALVGTGFILARNPDTVRAPDVAFVRKGKTAHPAPVGYPEFAPDLAVEVRSPNDRPGETLSNVGDSVLSAFACPLAAIL